MIVQRALDPLVVPTGIDRFEGRSRSFRNVMWQALCGCELIREVTAFQAFGHGDPAGTGHREHGGGVCVEPDDHHVADALRVPELHGRPAAFFEGGKDPSAHHEHAQRSAAPTGHRPDSSRRRPVQ
ncbi:hypothetical protein ACIBVM_05365 [[Kitasatospora] papulosa]|uniref:hypothetical protein n=1 Tax=Streptomyces TaxID=1883 RepID=UPI002E11A9FB|nr:hypothetical protein OG483_00925 [[Kitasatospora] papulosa]